MENKKPGREYDHDKYRSFVSKLKEEEAGETDKIITRYALYQPEMTDAALHVAVEKGLINYDLKEKLSEQIRRNLSEGPKYGKQKTWEKSNAFTGYVSRYSDNDIYEIIESPSGMIIDVYHAVLLVALERELISEGDFTGLFNDSLKAIRTDDEIENDDMRELFIDIFQDETPVSDVEAEAERLKYWKCMSCGENVKMESEVCPHCNSTVQGNPEHPGMDEIKKEMILRNPSQTSKFGLGLIIAGTLLVATTAVAKYFGLGFRSGRYYDLVFGGIVVAAGVFIIIYSFFMEREK